jgi:hypothetical protein
MIDVKSWLLRDRSNLVLKDVGLWLVATVQGLEALVLHVKGHRLQHLASQLASQLAPHLGSHLGSHLRILRPRMLWHVLRRGEVRMVRGERVVRALPAHPISWGSGHVRLRRSRRAVSTVCHARRVDVGTTLRTTDVWTHGWLSRAHSIARNKRLSLWVECVALITTRNRMLALRVIWVDIDWELSIRIRDPDCLHVALRLRLRTASWLLERSGDRRGTLVVSRLLPAGLRRRVLHRRSVPWHRSRGGWVSLLGSLQRLRRILYTSLARSMLAVFYGHGLLLSWRRMVSTRPWGVATPSVGMWDSVGHTSGEQRSGTAVELGSCTERCRWGRTVVPNSAVEDSHIPVDIVTVSQNSRNRLDAACPFFHVCQDEIGL